MVKGKWKENAGPFHLPFTICHQHLLHSDLAAEERELLLLLLVLNEDGGFHKNEQDLFVLGTRAVGEESFEERDLAEHGNTLLTLGFTRQGLTAKQKRRAVRDGARGSDSGDELRGQFQGAGDG